MNALYRRERASMGASVDGWIRTGLLALPVYGLLTLWATFTHQPDPGADFGAYAEYVVVPVANAPKLFDAIAAKVKGVVQPRSWFIDIAPMTMKKTNAMT